MKPKPLVSIIVNNYNYDRFLRKAIDSALAQTYSLVEIIVVDDGSTDQSREIIASYCDRIIPVLKENGGQASAFNSGMQASSGSILCFLDSDDIFYPHKVETVVNLLSQIGWQNEDILLNNFSEVIDQHETPIKIDLVSEILSAPGDWHFLPVLAGKPSFFDGQLSQVSTPEQTYQFAAKYRFLPYLGVQTSGITMTKSLADKIFPLPEKEIKVSADVFLVKAASLYGAVYATNHTLSQYRAHGSNHWYGRESKTEFSRVEKFFAELNDFLNAKLVNIGKKPVFSYLDSMSAKGYYRYYFGHKCYRQLFNLAIKVLHWQADLVTMQFFAKTMALAIYFRFRCSLVSSKS